MATVKLKRIEHDLEGLKSFTNPDVRLEQYQTPARFAAELLHYIDIADGIAGKTVLDLGCGCGILGFGCVRLAAAKVVGVDIDDSALSVAIENKEDVGLDDDTILFLNNDVVNIDKSDFSHSDMVIMNPPFGTKKQPNIDEKFVVKALELADIVYSVHKSSTRHHWGVVAQLWKEKFGWNIKVQTCIAGQPFTIPRMYKFHKKQEQEVLVDLMRFCHQ